MRFTEIFVPGGFPRHTYNPRLELQLETKLSQARNNLCKLVTVTGHTKSGKTVLTRKVFPRDEAVWIDGGTVLQEDDLWGAVLEQLDVFTSTTKQEQGGSESTYGGKASAGADFFVAQGTGELNVANKRSTTETSATSRSVSPRVAALQGLRAASVPLIIDDFHYLAKDLQGAVVRALKPLVFDGVPIVVIAIPHRRYDAMKVEREMTGRVFPIEIPVWSQPELAYIPDTGFDLLGYTPSSAVCTSLTEQAIGSPHLMQDFCRTICTQQGIEHSLILRRRDLALSEQEIGRAFSEVANTIGRPIFEKLARGPTRTDRIPRGLKGGRTCDIYELVLHALAHLKPGLTSLEYEELRSAIREVCTDENIPQLHEISRVLGHMSTIASSDESSTPVIDFDEDEKKLHITDPFFAFYLRWGDID